MELKFILEAILFQAQKPLNPEELRELLRLAAERAEEPPPKAFKKVKLEEITSALEELERDHAAAQRSYRLVCVAGAWQVVSQPEYGPWLRVMFGAKARPPRLSQPALETVAIIAYRQPLTRAEIEQVRGVSVDGVMQTLIDRELVQPVGRSEVIGHPITYGTTVSFLEYFGLRSLEDLPAADELRRVEIKKPAALLTTEPGLATPPPQELAAPPAAAPIVESNLTTPSIQPSAGAASAESTPPAEPVETVSQSTEPKP